jgi:hypothetical protein
MMKCDDALEQLESARHGSGDREEPELSEAAGHVRQCADCRSTLQQRERLDLQIGRAMRDVPLPDGLKDRLLASLEATAGREPSALPGPAGEPSEATPVEKPASAPEKTSRRKLLVKFVAAACAAAAVVFVVVRNNQPAPETRLALDDVYRNATLDVSQLAEFDGNFEAPLPGGVWRDRSRFEFRRPAGGDLAAENGFHRTALYEFRINGRHGGSVTGKLLVVPRSSLQDPPGETAVNLKSAVYAPRKSGDYRAFAWSSPDDDVVYICFIPAGDEPEQALKTALRQELA